jgi:hypothetical protein
MSYGQNAPTSAQDPAKDTEMATLIRDLRGTLSETAANLGDIARRVLPPGPQGNESATVKPIATTYAQQLQELCGLAEIARTLASEMNGRI